MAREQTLGEEIANSITHGLGAAAAIGAVPPLIVAAAGERDAWRIVGASVFGTTLILLFLASTLYHALPRSRAKQVFRVLDHSAIYLLIAGTYTPFTLGALRGPWGWTLFGLVWGLGAIGIVVKATAGFRFPRTSTAIYLALGWLVLIGIHPLLTRVPPVGIAWLAAGGLLYSAGVAFYAWERLRFGHAIWHGFVIAGSFCHYVAVFGYAGGPLS